MRYITFRLLRLTSRNDEMIFYPKIKLTPNLMGITHYISCIYDKIIIKEMLKIISNDR